VSHATVLDSLLRRMLVAAFGMLDATDREAVCGDLAESRETTVPALREVLSLVLRRRTASLGNWHPWLTLAALTIPLAAFVSLTARSTADGSAIYLWLYLNNWDWTYTKSLGFWQELIQCAQGVLLSCVALVCWSWTSGLLLGWSARRTLWLQGAVFFAVVVTVGAHGVPLSFGHVLVLQRARNYQGNAAVFAQAFYRQVFPRILRDPLRNSACMERNASEFPNQSTSTKWPDDSVDLLRRGGGYARDPESRLVANAGLAYLAASSASLAIAYAAGHCSSGSLPASDTCFPLD
jgi:hypothetical protein